MAPITIRVVPISFFRVGFLTALNVSYSFEYLRPIPRFILRSYSRLCSPDSMPLALACREALSLVLRRHKTSMSPACKKSGRSPIGRKLYLADVVENRSRLRSTKINVKSNPFTICRPRREAKGTLADTACHGTVFFNSFERLRMRSGAGGDGIASVKSVAPSANPDRPARKRVVVCAVLGPRGAAVDAGSPSTAAAPHVGPRTLNSNHFIRVAQSSVLP